MKSIRTSKLGLLAAAGAILIASASVQQAQAQNANHNRFDDLVFYFLKDETIDTSIVVVALPTLTTIRDLAFAGAGGYTVLNSGSAVNTALSNAFGAGWATQTDLWAGAGSVRGTNNPTTSIYVDSALANSGDPRRTVYYTQPRSNNSNPGQSGSGTASFTTDSDIAAIGVGMDNGLLQTIESGSGFAVESDRSSSTLGNQVDLTGGNTFSNLDSNVNTFSTAFTFGPAGSGVVLALDLYRLKPGTTNITGEVNFPGESNRTSVLMGQVVLKDTGEIGFVAIPEPSTVGLLALGAIGGVVAFVRRRKVVKA